MKTGTLIRLLRVNDGQSQTLLAEDLGVARPYLSQIENGKTEPGLSLLKAVARRFDIPLALLVIGQSAPETEIYKELRRLLAHVLSSRLVATGG